jgi:iron complex outermembrane receptor protein
VTRFTNAGEISTRGVEVDFVYQPVRDVSISGGGAFTDGKVDQFRVPANGNTANVIPNGTRLGAAIRWKGSLAADYRIRTPGPIDFGVGAQVSYQSEQAGQFSEVEAIRIATTIPSYALVNLNVSLMDDDERFRLMAQVKNLFDVSFPASIGSGGPGGSYRYIIPREADRYYGITARFSF